MRYANKFNISAIYFQLDPCPLCGIKAAIAVVAAPPLAHTVFRVRPHWNANIFPIMMYAVAISNRSLATFDRRFRSYFRVVLIYAVYDSVQNKQVCFKKIGIF